MHALASRAQLGRKAFTSLFLERRFGLNVTVIASEFIEGGRPKGIAAVPEAGSFSAEIENATAAFLKDNPPLFTRNIDFFWLKADRRLRYNVGLIAAKAQHSRYYDEYIRAFAGIFPALESRLERMRVAVNNDAEQCLSHLDQYTGNIIIRDGRPMLIDWGEGYLGRIGFDAGSCLMILFRQVSMDRFESGASRFLRPYVACTCTSDLALLVAAINQIFLPRSLWLLCRDDVIDSHLRRGKISDWRQKLTFLSDVVSGDVWPALWHKQ